MIFTMILLAFLMDKGVTQPWYIYSIPNLWAIILAGPVLVWFMIRRNKWARILGLLFVALSFAYVIDNLKCAFQDSDKFVHPESDLRFLTLSFAAGMLPVAAATAAFVLPKRKQKPPTTSAICAH